jgi:hypothetical protein
VKTKRILMIFTKTKFCEISSSTRNVAFSLKLVFVSTLGVYPALLIACLSLLGDQKVLNICQKASLNLYIQASPNYSWRPASSFTWRTDNGEAVPELSPWDLEPQLHGWSHSVPEQRQNALNYPSDRLPPPPPSLAFYYNQASNCLKEKKH